MTIKEIAVCLEKLAPLRYQEEYDNAGLTVGDPHAEITGAVLCVDVTDAVIDEALQKGANLIISHHPLVFRALKKFCGATREDRLVARALRENLALYACHTNLDAVREGISFGMAHQLGLHHIEILARKSDETVKIAVYVPTDAAEKVREAMFAAGAGAMGLYDRCSYDVVGHGTFRPLEGSQPYCGTYNENYHSEEVKIEMIASQSIVNQVVLAIKQSHPYETPALEVYALQGRDTEVGFGVTGLLPTPMPIADFWKLLKERFQLTTAKVSAEHTHTVSKIALCGGSGGFLIDAAIRSKSDVYVTGEIKYSDFFNADGKITIAEIGHFESEKCAIDILFDYLTKNFVTFALYKSEATASPIRFI